MQERNYAAAWCKVLKEIVRLIAQNGNKVSAGEVICALTLTNHIQFMAGKQAVSESGESASLRREGWHGADSTKAKYSSLI